MYIPVMKYSMCMVYMHMCMCRPTYTMDNDGILTPGVLRLSDITYNIVDLPLIILYLLFLLLLLLPPLSLSLLFFITTTLKRGVLGSVTMAMPEFLPTHSNSK